MKLKEEASLLVAAPSANSSESGLELQKAEQV